MKDSLGTGRGLLYMTLLMMVVLGVRHFDLLQSPNAYIIGDSLDGFRSIVANFYHIQHDAAYDHFLGMNYPYGDHPGYADTFPLLANGIKWFFENDASWLPGIWNLSMVFSQLLCGLFLFLAFRELKTPVWFSMLAALGIATLSPQLDRFAAHYCLSFSFILPLTIWLLIRFGTKPKISTSILIGLIPIFANQIHPYHMAMVVFLVAGYFFFRFIYQPSWKNLAWLSSHAAIQLVLPLLFLVFAVVLADPIHDRPNLPWGFTFYTTQVQSLLLPIDLPLGKFIDTHIDNIDWVKSETRAYLGMVVIFGGLFLLGRQLFRKIRPAKEGRKISAINPTLNYLLLASTIILFYAACLPFKVIGGEWMTDYLGLLRQFRTLGRFAWVFFYVSNIAVLYGLYQLIENIKGPNWRKFCYGLIFTILLAEGIGYLFWEKYDLIPRPENRELYSRADNPWIYSIDLDKYQAILPIPYYHVGSENFWISPIGSLLHRTTWAGADTGLPTMGAFLGRTSLSQTINLIEAVAEPYRRPAILDDFPDQRPLLVFVVKDAFHHLGYRYRHVLRGLTQLYEDETITLYEFPLSTFEEHVEKRHREYRTEVDTTTMYPQGNIWSKDSLPTFVYQSFDEEKAAYSYKGGAKAFASKEDHVLFDGQLPLHQTKERSVVSVWAKMDYDLAGRIRMTATEYQAETGEVIGTTGESFFAYVRSVDDGWMLIDIPLNLKKEDSHLKVIISNNDMLYGQEFYLDEFQIRTASSRVYRVEEDWIVVNNRWIPRKKQD